MATIDDVLSRLHKPKKNRDGWRARCPAHDGVSATSLAVAAADDGRALLFCFSGCSYKAIIGALGLADGADHRGVSAHRRVKRIATDRAAAPDAVYALKASRWATAAADEQVADLARSLGVSSHSLRRLGVGWNGWAWSFPMRDSAGVVVGIRLRKRNGEKLAVRGGLEGLFIPSGLDPAAPLFIVEGPTDCAAVLDCGLSAIGRPCCSGAVELTGIVAAGRPVVIVADADDAGRRGAERLAAALIVRCPDVRLIFPPNGAKDIRDAVRSIADPCEALRAIWLMAEQAAPLRVNVRGVRR